MCTGVHQILDAYCSIAFGAQKIERIPKYLANSAFLSVIVVPLNVLLITLVAPLVCDHMLASVHAAGAAALYVRWMALEAFFHYFAVMFFRFGLAVQSAHHYFLVAFLADALHPLLFFGLSICIISFDLNIIDVVVNSSHFCRVLILFYYYRVCQ